MRGGRFRVPKEKCMAEERVHEVIAVKKPSEKRMLVFGGILCALAAVAAVSAAVNAKRGYGFIVFGCVVAFFAAALAVYAFVFFAAHKKMPDALVYTDGEALFVYLFKEKAYRRLPFGEIKDAEGGILPRDSRQGILRIRTQGEILEVFEVANVFAAKEKILRLCFSKEEKRD